MNIKRPVRVIALIILTAIVGQCIGADPGGNPIFRDVFTADPAAMIVGDTVYVYAGHDNAKEGQFFSIPDWLCYSSKDMKNWTAHGPIMRPEEFQFARRNVAWAAHMIEKDGKYYFYTTLRRNNNNEHCIGVAVGDSPVGPFKDARGTPLITDDMTTDSRRPNADIDPAVFIDDDGIAWLAWGNGDCYLVKLKPNMIELDGPIKKLDITPYYSEGPWIFKRGDLYYNIFAVDIPGTQPEQIGYATAPAVEGPWTYRGLVTGPAKTGFTIHPAVIEFKGQWYFFYHCGSTSINGIPGGDCRRSVRLEYLYFNADGTIQPITQTTEGVSVLPKVTKPSAQLFPLNEVRLLDGPFSEGVKINHQYLLAHDPDRLLAPFRREAGLPPKARPYGNWESGGLDGHTAGHYLSALSLMMASGSDADGEFHSRLDYMIDELAQIQKANGNGYLGGIPGSRDYWKRIGEGNVELIWRKWAPWYNLHKMYAGLRDAYIHGGNNKALELLVAYGDWCEKLTSGLSDAQMQQMLTNEYGGMNEVLADIYVITGDRKYLELAKRFNHRAVFEPLENHQDRLTGLHANTQIPKIIGMERIAALIQDENLHGGAKFFWKTVTQNRSVAFGGNSVSEHFNDPKDFSRMISHREGPETCNTYNMLRLTEQLFTAEPKAAYADYYERALYNHILASIHPTKPGYVYFTPIRPDHYRVYSQPEQCFWCCVGTGMENPARYGEFIYAKAKDGVYVNLFIPSKLSVPDYGMVLKQETTFPDEAHTKLSLQLEKPATFTLHIRHPAWVNAGDFAVKVNGRPIAVKSTPSSYAAIRRQWTNGDTIDIQLPMHIRAERLPDGSDWVAIMYGPIVLAKPDGTDNMNGLFADDGRMAHVAHGPMVPFDKVPALLTTEDELPKHIVPDPSAGPLHFRIMDVIEPAEPEGLPLAPFFRLHERRYQMYWELTNAEQIAARKEKLAAEERARAAREAATLDWIAVGEQQSEVEHDLKGEGMASGIHNGRRWRHGAWIQYTLDPRGSKEAILAVTYSGDDRGREFDISVNDKVIATQSLTGEKPNHFIEKRYPIPSEILQAAGNDRLSVRFTAKRWLAGGVYDVRLLKPDDSEAQPSLRTAFEDRFDMAVALDGRVPDDYSAKELDLIRTQFSVLTPANCMKMYHVQRRENIFDFDQADALVTFAEANDQKVLGHCLIWAKDERTPAWFFQNADNPPARQLLLQRMRTHIETVVARYRGKVQYWDVINEALADDENFIRPSTYLSVIGEDFISKAFEYARAADPDAILIYNDYNLFFPNKQQKLRQLLQYFKDHNVPVDAIGIQGHFELDNIPYDDLEATIALIKSFGLKMVVSELDIDVVLRSKWWAEGGKFREELAKYNPYNPSCPPEILRQQAAEYARLFAFFIKHADTIQRVTFWGLHDGQSWLNDFPWKRTNHPLLFDRNAEPKPAYHAVLSVR